MLILREKAHKYIQDKKNFNIERNLIKNISFKILRPFKRKRCLLFYLTYDIFNINFTM